MYHRMWCKEAILAMKRARLLPLTDCLLVALEVLVSLT